MNEPSQRAIDLANEILPHWRVMSGPESFAPDLIQSALDAERAELEAWKESAMKVMPDFQAIGKVMGLRLGQDVSPRILPFMKAMAAMLDRVPHEGPAWIACVPDCPACAWARLKGSGNAT